ncbi:MAG: amidoligase family protein, partial [Bacilli bacterium]|nr:amidoligase family protein [Bacilli bacterium]
MGMYRYDIGLGNKYLFGNELEFTGVYLEELSKQLRSSSLPVRYAINHKSRGYTKYDEWYLDLDSTVTRKEDGKYFGGELSSRILTDKKKIWMEVKDICDVLKYVGAYVNERCSNHVRVNLSSIRDERYFFEVLSKLIALYEVEIRLFYMGDDYYVRRTSFEYARPLATYLLDYINKVNFSADDFYYRFRNNGITLFSRNDGINLQEYEEKRLMEIRYANGTINEKTIQNNSNFSLKLVDAIDRKVFDPQELTKRIEDGGRKLIFKHISDESDFKEFEWLVRSIATSEEDIDDFMTQYEHVLSKRPRV